MKILWHSNAPWTPTGYGVQTKHFTKRLVDLGHEVSISSTWGLNGGIMNWNGMRVFPSDEMYGNRLLPELADLLEVDLIIGHLDTWVLKADLLKGIRPFALWFPIDHEPIPPNVLKPFKDIPDLIPIVQTRFGKRMMRDQGIKPYYIPAAVDTSIYKPNDNRKTTREVVGIPEDAFVIGMVAANQGNNPPRKGFHQALEAFSEVLKDIPNAYLYLHTNIAAPHAKGINLHHLMSLVGVPAERVFLPTPIQLYLGFNDHQMANLFNMMDVLMCPSYGEGFGVPIIEAQACGTPVIVTNYTAMPELCGAGWKVGGDRWYDAYQGAFFMNPSIEGLKGAIMMAYEAFGDQGLRNNARNFALNYDISKVTYKYWKPTLEKIATKLKHK